MPNDCWNYITFRADKEEVDAFILEEFKNLPDWALEIKKRGCGAVHFKLWSAWKPDFVWFEVLITKYPNCWIKNDWINEAGDAGVWVGFVEDGSPVIKRLEWDDMSIEEEFYNFREV